MAMGSWRKAPDDLVERFGAAVALPSDVVEDPDAARGWVEQAADYVRTLPPKAPQPKKR